MNPSQQFLDLTSERRALAFGQVATQRAIDPVIIEKDFWVCWILGVIFDLRELAPHLVFKGGTSLSKVFGAIDRFSEDVDLSLSPAYVGADPRVLSEASSRRQLDG
jgi:predicted nucleotidyltransferase component of viral defense system